MLRTALITAALVGAAFLSIEHAQAAVIIWDLATPSGLLGNSQNYTAGSPPVTITATGFINGNFSNPANQTALFGKQAGGIEVGLGLNDDPSGGHELSGTNWVQLNVTNAVADHVQGLSFIMNSTTRVFGSNSATSLGAQLPGLIGFDEGVSHSLPTGFDFFNFQAVTGNVLVFSISGDQTAISQLSTYAMMLLGFAGLGYASYRKARPAVSNRLIAAVDIVRRPSSGGLSFASRRQSAAGARSTSAGASDAPQER